MIDTAELILVVTNSDASGTEVDSIVSRKGILCSTRSIGMKETYQAMSVERKPEVCLVLENADDYGGEQYAVWKGSNYKILRTFQKGFSLELTLEKTRDLDGLV